MDFQDRPRRVNGLSPPYTHGQMATWVFLPALILEFVFFVTPILPVEAAIPVTILFLLSCLACIYYAYMAMKVDPRDPRLEPNYTCTRTTGSATTTTESQPTATKQCWICDKQVGEKSMHCKYCNKCVDHFDHHCMWLNTCVGKANYSYFFRTMVAISLLLFIHGVTQIVLLIDVFVHQEGGATRERTNNWFSANGDPTIALVVIWCIFLFLDLASFSLIAQLLSFHIKLQREGLTTYAFIVRDNQRRREKTKQDNELASKRGSELQKARDQGRSCYEFQLQWGGFIRKTCGTDICDPVRETPKKVEEGRGMELIHVSSSREEGHETVRETSP